MSLFRCTFTGNSDFLEGVVACFNNIAAKECIFADNSGWMAGAISGGSIELEDCEFTGNSGTLAGAIESHGDLLVATGCLFSGNSSKMNAGAIFGSSAVMRLSNCTFAGNRGQPNAIDYWGSDSTSRARLTQCIVWEVQTHSHDGRKGSLRSL